LRLTASGDAIAQCAELMERQVDLANESLGAGHGQYAGSVKLTSVPIVANRLLVPAIGKLLDKHPALQLELIPDSGDLSLSRREADLAIRHARPSTGGASVKARRIGTLQYSVYAARSCSVKATASVDHLRRLVGPSPASQMDCQGCERKRERHLPAESSRCRDGDAVRSRQTSERHYCRTSLGRESRGSSGLKQMRGRHCRCGRCGCSPMLTRLTWVALLLWCRGSKMW
jgi:DNA-binding transcriptional LysR family regulator